MTFSSSVSPLDRIRRIAWIMRRLIALGILLDITAVLAVWEWDYLFWHSLLPALGLTPDQVSPTPDARLLGLLFSGPSAGIVLVLLIEAYRLFGDYAGGQIFAPVAIDRLGRLAWGMIILAAVQSPLRTLQVLALTLHNPPGHRLLSIGLSSAELMLAFFGGLLLAITWVMREAGRIATENSEFV